MVYYFKQKMKYSFNYRITYEFTLFLVRQSCNVWCRRLVFASIREEFSWKVKQNG